MKQSAWTTFTGTVASNKSRKSYESSNVESLLTAEINEEVTGNYVESVIAANDSLFP